MSAIRFTAVTGLLAMMALSGCQTPPSAPEGPAASTAGRWTDSEARPFRERRGWTVQVMQPQSGKRAHCVGRRAGSDGLRIAFVGGDPDSGFRLSGFATGLPEGSSETLLVKVEPGERRKFEARILPGPVLEVVFPTLDYDHALHPFARGRSVTFEGQRMGMIGTLNLEGSAWTVNATDECRRMNVPG